MRRNRKGGTWAAAMGWKRSDGESCEGDRRGREEKGDREWATVKEGGEGRRSIAKKGGRWKGVERRGLLCNDREGGAAPLQCVCTP